MQHVSDLHSKFALEMWANAQRDGRPVEYRWRPLFNAGVWLCSITLPRRHIVRACGGDIAV